ncbi:MAG TPA: GAP family protein [Solirubrobacteraceae bacterium]|nr:GAP family protein [Solirubrobacteraceae bacterium]
MSRVILFSLTAMVNPTLVAATTVMLLLPSPKKLMLGYLLGAYMTSITIGCVVVLSLGESGAVSTTQSSVNPGVDLAIGGLLLAIGFVLGTGRDRRYRERRAQKRSRDEPKKTPRWQEALGKGNPRVTFVVGALLTLPGASYLAALDGIHKLNYGKAEDVLLVVMVNVIMLALIEVPLLSFTIAPKWTPAALERAKGWFGRHGHTAAFIAVTTIGALLVVQGVVTLIAS